MSDTGPGEGNCHNELGGLPEVSPHTEVTLLSVGIELVPSRGGTYKTLRQFKSALCSTVVSFTPDEQFLEATSEFNHLRLMRGSLGRMFHLAPRSEIMRLDQMLYGVNLLALHVLFRQSSHWIWTRARRLRIPYWVVPHGCLDPYVFTYRSGRKRLWMALFGRRILRDASRVIFSTRREMEKAAMWVGSSRACVIPWPADSVDVSKRQLARDGLRKRLGISQDARILLFLGRLHSMKRPLETIRLFSMTNENLHLVIAGPGDDINLEQVLKEVGASTAAKRIHVIGPCFREEKQAVILGCDGFVSLSKRENFNHAAVESMGAGLPVILSAGNDLGPDLVSVHCGWILGDETDESTIRALHQFGQASASALQLMGERGRNYAQVQLSFARFETALRELALETIAEYSSKVRSKIAGRCL